MLRFLGSQLRHRPSRPAALGAGILVAAVSFVLLASAAKTSAARVRGSVESNYRAAYDILVRPQGSTTQLERLERLVRPNYISGIYGGISLRQYHAIEQIPGVEVAAPIANVGVDSLARSIPIRIDRLVDRALFQLYRIKFGWLANSGVSKYPLGTGYIYYERRDRWLPGRGYTPGGELLPGRSSPLDPCADFGLTVPTTPGPFSQGTFLTCSAARSPVVTANAAQLGRHDLPLTAIATWASITFPTLIAAIDPVQEARLLQLDRTIVGGRYLRQSDRTFIDQIGGPTADKLHEVPAIVSARSYVDEKLSVTIERLRIPAKTNVPVALTRGYDFVTPLKGTVIQRRLIGLARIYANVLHGLAITGYVNGQNGRVIRLVLKNRTGAGDYYQVSDVRYRKLGHDHLAPVEVRNPLSVWQEPQNSQFAGGYLPTEIENEDVQFRHLVDHFESSVYLRNGVSAGPVLDIVGTYDPRKLPEFSPLSRVPLETYYPPQLQPANAASRKALQGRPLLPTQNVGDYIQQPPLILTTLEGLKAFLQPQSFSGVSTKEQQAPISVIRIRVKGVKGPDALSQERVRTVATLIHDRTGLVVDITAGSSPHPVLISLPKGKFGRPRLLLSEGWSRKGVSVSFLRALDRKDLALFALIPAICAFFLANGAFAAARSRRREIGTLLCLGWSQGAIFSAVLGELVLIGLIAGVLGTGLAAAIATFASLKVSALQVAVVLPVSLVLALVSGLIPAWRAARSIPLDAVNPPIAGSQATSRVRRMSGLALVNLRRVPLRTLLGAGALAVGVAALTLLIGIERAFRGTLVGTLLGNAISFQVRGVDFLAVGLTIALAALALADVLFLNLRERAAEFVTLRTVGWSDRHLATLTALEALGLGLIGSSCGVAIGLILGAAFLAVPLGPLVLAGLVSAVGGVLVALVASLLPVSQIGRLTPPTVLAAE
jgi:hypothetical protein